MSYLFEGTPDDIEHGRVYLGVSATCSNMTGMVDLTVHLDWTVEFSAPDLPTTNDHLVTVMDGWTPYFTDSVTGWHGGTRLTFKHKEGGGVVPFANVDPQKVYELASLEATCKYYTAAGLAVDCRFIAAIKDYDPPVAGGYAMAPFHTLADAQNYLKTGSATYLTLYAKAGPWVHPQNPDWKPVWHQPNLLYTNIPEPCARVVPEQPLSGVERRLFALERMVSALQADTADDASSAEELEAPV
jgi:hypothetical protein